MRKLRLLLLVFSLTAVSGSITAQSLKALIIDGQNNHDWKTTTPILKEILEKSQLFSVSVATSPPAGSDMSGFKPDLRAFDVVISNYNGEPWSEDTREDFVQYVASGGGFVSVHAANNAFPMWRQYNEMIGLGGWGDRDERWGPFVYFEEGEFIYDHTPGEGGGHGRRHPFEIVVRNGEHPITRDLPKKWMHAEDELYHQLRGPAHNITFLATAYSDPQTGGTGRHEPMLFVMRWRKGRIFHTTLGHHTKAVQSRDFIVTLQRGAEWAATGKVTQKVPEDFRQNPMKISQVE